jgi:hypothetical protein
MLPLKAKIMDADRFKKVFVASSLTGGGRKASTE